MGIDFVRGNNGRCPSFVVGGLLVLCLFLTCNWWSLSSQNFELLRQMDDMAEQLKINGEELDKCTRHKSELDERLKKFQDGAAQQRVRLDQMRVSEADLRSKLQKDGSMLSEVRKKADDAESAVAICTAELESLKQVSLSKDKSLETLRTEKKDLLKNIETGKVKIKELREAINTLKKNLSEKDVPPSIVHLMRNAAGDSPNAGMAISEDHERAAAQDENTAAENKTDNEPIAAPVEQDKDPRQQLMGTM